MESPMAESAPDPRRLRLAAERHRLELQWLSQDHALDGWKRSHEDWSQFLDEPGVIDQCRHTLEAGWRGRHSAPLDPVFEADWIGEPWSQPRHPAIHFWHALIAFLFADNVSLEDDQHH
jgi:hypothetical protein